ncbi:hypothetical protein WT83_04950 [Burkholderia territorii]|uniref:Uncharacterized protein n=1 Tax=Burkholderia territorii TaxID=1503055 RepID=A0A125K935_9BURK|nr:hypothetical protein [Burkholderia territorii]KWN22022.1 hypothetical protein WT83_04950 [Burkholderia territorii]
MFLVEQVTNQVRFLLPPMQTAPDIPDHFRFVGRAALAKRIGFRVLIQQLIRAQLGTVDQSSILVYAGETA